MGKGPLPTTDTLTLSPPASAAAPRAILRKDSRGAGSASSAIRDGVEVGEGA